MRQSLGEPVFMRSFLPVGVSGGEKSETKVRQTPFWEKGFETKVRQLSVKIADLFVVYLL